MRNRVQMRIQRRFGALIPQVVKFKGSDCKGTRPRIRRYKTGEAFHTCRDESAALCGPREPSVTLTRGRDKLNGTTLESRVAAQDVALLTARGERKKPSGAALTSKHRRLICVIKRGISPPQINAIRAPDVERIVYTISPLRVLAIHTRRDTHNIRLID